MIKQCNAITTKNEYSLYRKSRENRAEKKSGSEKLIKSPRNRLVGALLNEPLVPGLNPIAEPFGGAAHTPAE